MDREYQKYMLSIDEIFYRQQVLLESIRNTFIKMHGATSSSALPHFNGLYGIAMERVNREERLGGVSGINPDFIERNKRLSTNYRVFEDEIEFQELIDYYKSKHLLPIIRRNMEYVERYFNS